MEIEGICVSKNLDETVRLKSEKREEWIREIRGERHKRLQMVREVLSVLLAHQHVFPREKRVFEDQL